jgi:hypothetical protein
MAFNPQPLCKVCQACIANPELLDDIYKSSYFMGNTGKNLQMITKEQDGKFGYNSLLKHVKKHQTIQSEEYTDRRLKAIAKKANNRVARKELQANAVWDEVMEAGIEQLRSGEMKIKAADLLKATKDKSDTQLKKKDQEIATIEMVMHFASGESERLESKKYDRRVVEGETVTSYDPTRDASADNQRRQNESRGFYQSLAGNTFAPWTDEVSGGDDPTPSQD